MKRVLAVGLVGLAGAVAAAGWTATESRGAELDALLQLGHAQRTATDDIVARLADGRLTLAEAVTLLETRMASRPTFLDQLAYERPEGTDRERLAGFVIDRAMERFGDDPGKLSALLARVGAEGK